MSQDKYKELQQLVDSYLDSGLSAREYVEACVDAGDISASEALKLLSVLKEAQSVTFKLAEVTNGINSGLQMVLMRKGDEYEDDNPLFTITFDEALDPDRDEIIDALQGFAKELAVIATQSQCETEEAETIDREDAFPDEWFDYPNVMPASETRH